MLFGQQSFLSEINRFWICSVVGEKGSGKDLMVTELSSLYLAKGWKFYSNQYHLFNDPIYNKVELYNREFDWQTAMAIATVAPQYLSTGVVLASAKDALFRVYNASEGDFVMLPDIRRRVVSLSEAGRYLREYKYFEDLFEFARKVKNLFFFPSDRPSHIDLMRLHCYPIVRFDQLFGFKGGLWGYNVDTGYTKRRSGKFIWIPTGKFTGVYDTEDFSESPDILLTAVRKEIEIDQNKRGRNGISSMGATIGEAETDALVTYQRNIQLANLSLLQEARKSKYSKR